MPVIVVPPHDSPVAQGLSATHAQLSANRQQLGSIWGRLAKTEVILEQAYAAVKDSRALLNRLGWPGIETIPGDIA